MFRYQTISNPRSKNKRDKLQYCNIAFFLVLVFLQVFSRNVLLIFFYKVTTVYYSTNVFFFADLLK